MQNKLKEVSSFQLKGQSKEFADRQNDLFNQLDVLEKNSKNRLSNIERPGYNEETFVVSENPHRSETKSLRGKESIFKRPEAPISKCLPVGRVPDFRKNPQKWTKYTLNDVKDEDMSEKSNTAAAMSFLKELEARKETNDEMDCSSNKITFNKTALAKSAHEKECYLMQIVDQKITFKSTKLVMPEYVIGQKIKKNKKNKGKRLCNATKQLKLDHLTEVEDDVD